MVREDIDLASYYVRDSEEQRLNEWRTTLSRQGNMPMRFEEAKKLWLYLPKQSGVYYFGPPADGVTNMQLAVQLNAQGEPEDVEIHGARHPVYTLTTVVPAPADQVQMRTHKTTSVILVRRKGDPPTLRRLELASGQHLVNYVAIYPKEANYLSGQPVPFITPVLSMLSPAPDPVHFPKTNEFELVCGDLTAIITGPDHDRWPYSINGPLFRVNPSAPDRRQPYREFTIVYHYNFNTVQAFPQLNGYASTGGDFFGVNYGCAGIGAEILANRIGVGPMGGKEAVDLKFEEFFLSSWPCGDPAMVVDTPANAPWQALDNPAERSRQRHLFTLPSTAGRVAQLNAGTLSATFTAEFVKYNKNIQFKASPVSPTTPGLWQLRDTDRDKYEIVLEGDPDGGTLAVNLIGSQTIETLPDLPKGPKAKRAFYPDDPSNVYHSYMRDHVKFRVLNASEGITHVHHQHAHQWLHSPNSDNGQYLDSQTVVAGSGYTMEISHGGSGNRNFTVGDSIFHCHFYPHFAEGMWSLWRVHDVFEAGTKLDAGGIPDKAEEWNRALPDGEIAAGTPIPALVPMPSLAMAPPPARVRLTDKGRRAEVEAANQDDIDKARAKQPGDPSAWPVPDYQKSPGYPFFIPAVAGHRPPHPPLDYAWKEDEHGNPVFDKLTGKKVYLDGGLPRHQVLDGDLVRNFFTPWDFTKDFVTVEDKPPYKATAGGLVAFELPQEGTALEKAAMATHSTRARKSFLPNGDPGNFILNGLPGVPGAPYAPPGVRADGESNVNIRRYKAANLQVDSVINKKGWHYPQQRLLTLWQDVAPTVVGDRPPQPFFFRSNTDDTIEYWQTNLVPNYYEMDDFQVRTPTDILGQHIHLVKFDVTSSDGAGNGYNYEDGTFSAQEVRERIAAVNAKGGIYEFDPHAQFQSRKQRNLKVVPVAEAYPADPKDPSKGSLFGTPPAFQNWDGAQTTVQRFDTDPTLNDDGIDRTVRSVFTHDHFSPSTHQQTGFYAALLVEPDNSTWWIPEITTDAGKNPQVVYSQGGSRTDGGPTSWQANIVTANEAQSYREFAFEFQDMQLAYTRKSKQIMDTPAQQAFTLTPTAVAALGKLKDGDAIPAGDDVRAGFGTNGVILSDDAKLDKTPPAGFTRQILNPRKVVVNTPGGASSTTTVVDHYPMKTTATSASVYTPDMLPGWADAKNTVGAPGANPTTPKPQLISFGTIGTYSVNYRNDPLPLRVAEPVTGKSDPTDLAYAYASIARGDNELNTQPVGGAEINPGYKPPAGYTGPRYIFKWPKWPIALGMDPTDPYTPMMRAYANDRVQVRALAGAHMNEHSFLIHGVKFPFEPSYTNSGYQTTQAISLSEHFEMEFTVPARTASQSNASADFLYVPSANAQGQTSGAWGLLRAYDGASGSLKDPKSPTYLRPLPNNPAGTAPARVDYAAEFAAAPAARKREYTVIATTAQQILHNQTLTYNSRGQATNNYPFQAAGEGSKSGTGAGSTTFANPYALLYVNIDDVVLDSKGVATALKSDRRVEPLILRANAGDWIQVKLINQFSSTADTFTKGANVSSFAAGNPFVRLQQAGGGATINLNTSTSVGLHPQLVAYDISAADGMTVGQNPPATVPPGGNQTVYWYAGLLSFDSSDALVKTPIEFGSVALAPADPLLQHRKGLIGALVVEPEGSTWPKDEGQLESAPESQYVYNPDGTVEKIVTTSKKTRATATVTRADGSTFRELVLTLQTDAHMYQGLKTATTIPPLTSTNSPALNYRTEPLQYRYANGYTANTTGLPSPAGTAARVSNGLVSPQLAGMDPKEADPQTPVFTAEAGSAVRLRWIYPAGPGGDAGGSSQVLTVHGHVFQEEPYVNDSREIGFNPLSEWMGGRFILPGQTVDMIFPSAGGSFAVPGDFFYGAFIGQTSGAGASNEPTEALWGLFRVQP